MTKSKDTILLTFSGVDGSGKSTIAEKAVQYLAEKGKNPSLVEVYASSIFLNMGRVLGKISGKAKGAMEERMSSNEKGGGFIRILRVLCFFLDILIFRMRLFILNIKGVSPVCDRYLYDTLVHLRYLKALGEGMYKSFLKFIPEPDMTVVLSLNADLAMGREMQHDNIGYYEEKAALYKDLAEKKSCVVMDSSGDAESVWEKVKGVLDSRFL